MDFKQLQYFVSCAESLSFTRSAEALYTTQPAVSRTISDLEHELNVRLFNRDQHHVSLTPEGNAFYKRAVEILNIASAAKQELQGIAGSSGILRISVMTAMQRFVTDVLSLLNKRFPGISVELTFEPGKRQLELVQNHSRDLYFTADILLDKCDGLIHQMISEESYHLFIPDTWANSVLATDFSTLRNRPLLVHKQAARRFFLEKVFSICQIRGLDVQPNVIAYNDADSIVTLANAGMGYMIMPESFRRGIFMDHLYALPIPGDDAVIKYFVAWDEDNHSEAIELFLSVLREFYPPL